MCGFNYVDPRDDMYHNHRLIHFLFQWSDGPHGGLGKTVWRREYVEISDSEDEWLRDDVGDDYSYSNDDNGY